MLFDKTASPGASFEEIGRSRAGLRSTARASNRYAMPPLVARTMTADAASRHARYSPPAESSFTMEELAPTGGQEEDAWLNDARPARSTSERKRDISNSQPVAQPQNAAPVSFTVAEEWQAYGPLGVFMQDEAVSEILVVGQQLTLIERAGETMEVACYFEDEHHLSRIIQAIQRASGSSSANDAPLIQAHLPGGARATIIQPPYAVRGPTLFIAKAPRRVHTLNDLVALDMLSQPMADYLADAMQARLNIAICGGLRSGRTTLLNALAGCIAEDERVVTLEESAALQLTQKHVVALEPGAQQRSEDAKARVTMRELLAGALHMHPERLLVDECRGEETGALLSALHAGHDGACFTLYATGVEDCLERLETTWLAQQPQTPPGLARAQFARMLHLVIFLARLPDGSRKVTHIAEVQGIEEQQVRIQDMFVSQHDAGTPD